MEAGASLSAAVDVVFHLDLSRYTPLAETPLGWFGPLRAVRRPRAIREVSAPPVFGRAMYANLEEPRSSSMPRSTWQVRIVAICAVSRRWALALC